ncbi:MAG: hypothetical protein RLZZ324_857 [Candidatus Parcubacteria bacterium]|jgi:hypothetical protein
MPQVKNALYDIATTVLGPDVFRAKRVIDVGCLRFAQTKAIKSLGADVIGIDSCKREEPPEGILFEQTDFMKWEPAAPVDVLYMSNVAQFIPTADVMAKIAALGPKTLIVRVMYDFPEPNWPADELLPLYFTEPEDWTRYFADLGYETKHARKYEFAGQDFKHRDRTFRFTEYIGVKK